MPSNGRTLREMPEYRAWQSMKTRCLNPNRKQYKDYGGRGIAVCAEWLTSFANFLAYIGPKPTPEHTLERIDNNSGYQPGNVKWALRIEQNHNTRKNRLLTINGETLCVAEWARLAGVNCGTLLNRLKRGISPAAAISMPTMSRAEISTLGAKARGNRNLTINGETRCLAEWSRLTGIGFMTLECRLKSGWTPEQAIGTPVSVSRKLDNDEVVNIRNLHASGRKTMSQLAEEFNVSCATISRIIRRKIWKDL